MICKWGSGKKKKKTHNNGKRNYFEIAFIKKNKKTKFVQLS
jgi:hypothetical protein